MEDNFPLREETKDPKGTQPRFCLLVKFVFKIN